MRIITFLFLIIFLTASSMNDARNANSAYERGDYSEAVQLYRQALEQDPENAKLYFNLAKSLYELGQTEDAMEAYDRFKNLAENPAEQSMADYNKGRMLADLEQYNEALNYFREALINNPDDPDAKHNYELALRKMQQQEQDNEQQQEQESGDDDQENGQQDNQQQEQDQQPDDSQQPGQPQDQSGENEQDPTPLNMSREEAENILDALEQLERELLENRKKESSESQSGNDKDW